MEAESVYLIKEFEEKAIFPGSSGKFISCHIVPGCTYKVLGDNVSVSPLGHACDTNQPFGAYSSFSPSLAPTTIPCPSTKFGGKGFLKIRRNVALVTLSLPADPDKPSSSKALSYSIDSQSCSPSAIVDLLSAQVGFEVILLDSKCYPILQNSATTEFGFPGKSWQRPK